MYSDSYSTFRLRTWRSCWPCVAARSSSSAPAAPHAQVSECAPKPSRLATSSCSHSRCVPESTSKCQRARASVRPMPALRTPASTGRIGISVSAGRMRSSAARQLIRRDFGEA
jgi:hypothetical protein